MNWRSELPDVVDLPSGPYATSVNGDSYCFRRLGEDGETLFQFMLGKVGDQWHWCVHKDDDIPPFDMDAAIELLEEIYYGA